MSKAHILVIADTPAEAVRLSQHLLPEAGYSASVADAFSPAIACDIVLVDVNHLRAAPFAGLQAQRHLGNQAPALLHAPRITAEMSDEVFSLGIRDFVRKPVEESFLIERLTHLVEQVRRELGQEELRHSLEQTRSQLTRRLNELNALSRIGRSITMLSDANTILARIVEAAVYLTHADVALIYLPDEENGIPRLSAHQGLTDDQLSAIQHPSFDSDIMAVLASGQPIIRSSEASGGSKITTGYIAPAALNMPIIAGRKVIGVMAVHAHSDRFFEQSDQVTLASLADYAAIALDKVRQLDHATSQVEAALVAAREVRLHAETLFSPIDGIESQIDTLLGGGFDPLTEAQHAAVARLKLAAERLKEIGGFIQDALAGFDR